MRDDRDGFACACAPSDKSPGDGHHLVSELSSREGLPDAVGVFVAHHGAVGIALRAPFQKVEQIDVRINLVLEWGGVLLDDAGVGHFVCAWCGLLRVGMIFTCHT